MESKLTYCELLNNVLSLENKVRQLEIKLDENRIKTEKLKSRFLSSVSHELRTPMNAILGFSNLLIDKDISRDKKEEYMEHINHSSNSLLKIVDSMIDVSLLEINELRINREICNIDIIVQQVYHYYNIDKHKLNKDHLAILLNKDKKVHDIIIYTDQFRLTQVLSNLLSNAIKFTNKGIIEFGYFVRDDDKLQFFVKDSGKGILAEKANSIFNKFEKLDEDYGCTEGVGLGLTLAQGIIRLLGGEIWVESNVFRGSTFNFTLDYLEKQTDDNNTSQHKQSIKSIVTI
jgi:signal transduction histidine kinase